MNLFYTTAWAVVQDLQRQGKRPCSFADWVFEHTARVDTLMWVLRKLLERAVLLGDPVTLAMAALDEAATLLSGRLSAKQDLEAEAGLYHDAVMRLMLLLAKILEGEKFVAALPDDDLQVAMVELLTAQRQLNLILNGGSREERHRSH